MQLWRCSPEDTLRIPCSSDSYRYPSLVPPPASLVCGVNNNNSLAVPILLNQEASTDMYLILLSSIGSYGSGSVNSMDWTSLESVSSPVEMRLHGPLPLRNSEELMALR
ncbi:unnamed protein product [Dibothriocephalus latus]|uniref:Uncharacterized protein n=1 Tax=Dibothriocephalus latus TaxID=60516 RepID=A0A3P7NNG5_DIBLA|nr:unnamed protein product [Dibothriocephalus latus]